MKKTGWRRLVGAVTAAVLLLTVLPLGAVGQSVFPWEREDNGIEQILQRDGYLEGIWFPWFNHVNLGHGLTSNEVMVEYVGNAWATVGLDDYGPENIYQQIYNLKALGFNLLGYEGSVYSEGVVLDAHGDVLGIKEEYLYNVRRFLDICRAVEMPVLWTVCCHSTSVNDYYEFGKMAWDVMTRYYADPVAADHYAERFVAPLCEVLAEYPDVVVMVAATVEAENEINDSHIGNHFASRELYGVTQEDMLYFIKKVNDTVAEHLPNVTRTIGSQLENMSVYRDIDFDMLGDQNYNYAGNSYKPESFMPSVPTFVSEFGLGFEQKYDDETFTELQLRFRDNFRRDGHKGWVMWCWSTDRDQPGSTFSLLRYGGGVTDFRSTAYDLHYYIEEYRAAHRGETIEMDAPVMFCNTTGRKVEWIAPRQAVSMDLERSDDAGENWTTLLEGADPADYVDRGKGIYTDPTAKGDHTLYRVTVRDAAGHTAVSAPSNEAGRMDDFGAVYEGERAPAFDWGPMPFNLPFVSSTNPMVLNTVGEVNNRPVKGANLLGNGSFEETQGGPWMQEGFFGEGVSIVTDPTAPDGGKTLYFDSSATERASRHTVWVDVEPDTVYVFSAWIKGAYLAADNRGYATLGVTDPETGRFAPYAPQGQKPYYTQEKQIVPTAWDEEWHLRSVSFHSGDRTRVGISLYGCASRMWVDDLALYKNGDGVKYVSENMSGAISFGFDAEYSGCDPQDCVTENVRFDEADSDFWQSGSGWKNGFMSITDGRLGYGPSLCYTASDDPIGLHYIKWVEVEPHTNYSFSMMMKVLEDGAGCMALINGKKRDCVSFIEFDFSREVYGEEWFPILLEFNTDSFTTIGIAVVDKGGTALFDNVRLFRTVDGKEMEDPYLEDKNGWVKEEGKWAFYENGTKVVNKWVKDSQGWCYLGADGYAVTNTWKKDSVGWCYLNGSGSMVKNAWVKDNGKWYYLDQNGYMVTNAWRKDSVGWVYLGSDGAMLTNAWCKDSKGWCYVGADGYAVTNTWKKDSVGWIWLDKNGSMTKNAWIKDNGKWYYLDANGYMVTNAWKKDSKGWVYLGSDGAMLTNAWCKDSKGWCYVGENGYAVTECWKKDSYGWIYLDKNGSMTKNAWVYDKGWYYLDGEGYMVANTSVNWKGKTYYFNASGLCTNP